MQKNYIQFLVLALVAIGMVMIAGIRNDVNSLESQVAFTGRALVNKSAEESGTAQKVANTPVKSFSLSEIENIAKKLGWAKQVDNSYSSGSGSAEKHYQCPNCTVGGGCCVHNGIGSWGNSGSEGCGTYGTVLYGGYCSVSRVAGGSGASSDRTISGSSTGSSGTAEKPKARTCSYDDQCPNPTMCYGGVCSDYVPNRISSPRNNTVLLSKTLKRGMIDTDVTKLQKMLVSLGFLSAAPSGNFLSKTEAGVKAFQTAYGISPVSGIVGPLTREKLNSMCTISSDGSVVSCSQ